MAPEVTVENEGFEFGNWEAQLAAKTAAELSPSLVGKSPRAIVEELLTCLRNEKEDRLSRNLNHWQEHAPRFLNQIARVWRERDHKDAFLRVNHARALRVAFSITDDRTLADGAVSDTDLEFLTGKVTQRHYFLALKRNATDILRQAQRERERFSSLESSFGSAGDAWSEDLDETSEDELPEFDLASSSMDGIDPLAGILRRQEQVKLMGDIARAKRKVETEWRYRDLRRTKWWKELVARDAKYGKKNAAKRPARSIT